MYLSLSLYISIYLSLSIYIYIYTYEAQKYSMKHRNAPKEKCPWCLSLWGRLGDTPPRRNRLFLGPYKALEGTNTKVTSVKGPFCAYPNYTHRRLWAADRRAGGRARGRRWENSGARPPARWYIHEGRIQWIYIYIYTYQ